MPYRGSRRTFLKAGSGIAVAGLGGCLVGGGTNETENRTPAIKEMTISSKNFTENEILGYMIYEVIKENTDILVADEISYGNTKQTMDGLLDGDTHTYWEYTGTLWVVHLDQEPIHDPKEQYERAREKAREELGIRVLDRTTFENTYAFFVQNSETLGIETISDLSEYVNAGNYDITIALESDFYTRADGWPELTDHYGFNETNLNEWEQNNGVVVVDVGLGYDEVRYKDVDIGLGYTTDAQLRNSGLETIADDKDFWPPYNPVPIIAEGKATDRVIDEINKIPAALDDAETMQRLNARVTLDKKSAQTVARSFLQTNSII